MQGEWFDRNHLLALARDEGGWGNLLRRHLPPGDWDVTVYPPYS